MPYAWCAANGINPQLVADGAVGAQQAWSQRSAAAQLVEDGHGTIAHARLFRMRRGRDTLAFGNSTGAMVFQGSLLPALALIITPWVANDEILGGIVATYVAGLWPFCITCRGQKKSGKWH